jgi:hypothetical protein
MNRYKLYKKNYKAGDKIYRLVIYENCYGKLFHAQICVNTIASVYRGNKNRLPIELKYPDKFGTYMYPEWIAPRTPQGKKFLQNRAKSVIRAKIGLLTKLQNEYRKLLVSFK